MANLLELQTVDSAYLPLTDLKGDPLGIRLKVAGPYSTQVQEATKRAERKRRSFTRRVSGVRKLTESQQSEMEKLTEEAVLDRLVSSVLGWDTLDEENSTEEEQVWISGVVFLGPEELPFSRANVEKVLEAVPYVKDQLSLFHTDEANFTSAS